MYYMSMYSSGCINVAVVFHLCTGWNNFNYVRNQKNAVLFYDWKHALIVFLFFLELIICAYFLIRLIKLFFC